MAVLLHIGGSDERLYLLCHLLCCPAGVGKWAAHFLQVSLGILSVIVVMLIVVKSFFCFFFLDPSLGDQLWSTAIYAGSYHLNVSYQVTLEDPVVQNDFDLIFHKLKINTRGFFPYIRRVHICLF